jgi:hypothetical protein
MDHQDHVRLIRSGVEGAGRVWADLGSGTGAFTLALAELLGPGAVIHSVDRDLAALRTQRAAMDARFPATTLHQTVGDFSVPLTLPVLDGVDGQPLHLCVTSARPGLVRAMPDQGPPCWSSTTPSAGNCACLISSRAWPALPALLPEATHEPRGPEPLPGAIYAALADGRAHDATDPIDRPTEDGILDRTHDGTTSRVGTTGGSER